MKRLTILSTAAAATIALAAPSLAQTYEPDADMNDRDRDAFNADGMTDPTLDDDNTILEPDTEKPDWQRTGATDGMDDDMSREPMDRDLRQQTSMRTEGTVMMNDPQPAFPSKFEQVFHAMDADDNDSVTRQEWGEWQADDGFYADRFDRFDGNGDDWLSLDEYESAARGLYGAPSTGS